MSKFNSYAQFKEDVVLMRAINHVHHDQGFYIDVGANDPERESVTKVFYDHGWRGINIDASRSWVERLQNERERDLNLHAAVTDTSGEIIFYDQPDGGLGTTVPAIAEMHRDSAAALRLSAVAVPAMTLTEICEHHAPAEIHFLKIDVEGGEGAVLRGMDFSRFRPWLLCIECHLPNHPEIQLYHEWEQYLTEADYQFVLTDTFNRFYLSNDHRDLLDRFALPIDDYRIYADVREIAELKEERRALRTEVSHLQAALDEVTRDLAQTREEMAGQAQSGLMASLVRKLRLG